MSTTLIGNQIPDQFPINAAGTSFYPTLVYVPDSYATSSSKYSLIIHLHGDGEKGTDLNKLINTSLPQRIAQGFKPISVKGTEFIVVSPQCPTFTPQWWELKYIIPGVIKKYRIDVSRIYVTGYSYGGYGTWTCLTEDLTVAKLIAAISPVCAATLEGDKISRMAPNALATKMPILQICGTSDSFIGPADQYQKTLSAQNYTPMPIEERIIGGVHFDAWNFAYNPASKILSAGGINIYDWFDQYSLAPAVVAPPPVTVPPPVVIPPKTIKSITITYSDGSQEIKP